MEVRDRIRDFILESVLAGSSSIGVADDDSFMDKGLIDSTGILELVAFIQDEFKIDVRDEELIPDNFDSVAKLSSYISRKTGG